jgi:hypothetical protein
LAEHVSAAGQSFIIYGLQYSQKKKYNHDDYSNKSISKKREKKIANTRFNLTTLLSRFLLINVK